MLHNRSFIVTAFIAATCMLLVHCVNHQEEREPAALQPDISNTKKINYAQYAGAAACAKCHKQIHDSQVHTAHYHSSAPATRESILGSFENGKNVFAYNGDAYVQMESTDSGFYQVAYVDGLQREARRFDIVVGSGTKGQTSLWWRNHRLYQLPITYFSKAAQWSNSPGFPQRAVFNRPITSRCMECHSTYASNTDAGHGAEAFNPEEIIYGITCERCHGPGMKHIAYQLQHPEDSTAKYIVNTASLGRQQQLDACAVCHGGRLQKTRPSFEFTSGQRLSDYFLTDSTTPDPQNIDLHGNQYGLLKASKCFRMSTTLTCNTCHQSHINERGKAAVFAERCQTCHSPAGHGIKQCKLSDSLATKELVANCIDCHMPAKPSRAIAVFLPGKERITAALIRSHYISIYPQESAAVLQAIRKKK